MILNKIEKYIKPSEEVGIRVYIVCTKCGRANEFEFPKGTVLTIFNNTSVLCTGCSAIIPRQSFLDLKDKVLEDSRFMLTEDELDELKNPDHEKVWIDKSTLDIINGTKYHKQRIINKILKESIKKDDFFDNIVDDLLEAATDEKRTN